MCDHGWWHPDRRTARPMRLHTHMNWLPPEARTAHAHRGHVAQAVSRAQGTLNSNKTKIMADFAPDRKGDGEAAIAKLDAALKDFQKTIQAGDKQACPPLCSEAVLTGGCPSPYLAPLLRSIAPLSTALALLSTAVASTA